MKNANDLREQNELADALISKMERIQSLWAELPTVDDLDEIVKAAGSVAASLQQATEAYNAKDFPSEANCFDELCKQAGELVASLEQAAETYNAADFPTADDFDDLDKRLGGIVGNLNEILENQEQVAS